MPENKEQIKAKLIEFGEIAIKMTYIYEEMQKHRREDNQFRYAIEVEEIKKGVIELIRRLVEINRMYGYGNRYITTEMHQLLKKVEEDRLEDISVDECFKCWEDGEELFKKLDYK